MKKVIGVTGASGTLGRQFIKLLRQENAEFVIGTRSKPEAEVLLPKWQRLDLETCEGVGEFVDKVDIIVHLASDTKTFKPRVDVGGTWRLLEYITRKNRVQHIIYLSIVGINKIPIKYYQTKLRTEKLFRQKRDVPYTILRTTQFHPFLEYMISRFTRFPIAFLFKDIKVQPIDTAAVVKKILELCRSAPQKKIIEMAGPEVLSLGDAVKSWKIHRKKRVLVLYLPPFLKTIRQLTKGALTSPDKSTASKTWEEWLSEK